MTTSMRARGILIFVEMMDGFAMQSSRRLELYRNGIKNHGRQLPVAGDRADLPDGMSKGIAGPCGSTMYLGLHGFELAGIQSVHLHRILANAR